MSPRRQITASNRTSRADHPSRSRRRTGWPRGGVDDRPQTNGKIERFHRTLGAWAFDRFYPSEAHRRAALPAWLHDYNHHRPHTAIGRQAPITRLTNVPGQHI